MYRTAFLAGILFFLTSVTTAQEDDDIAAAEAATRAWLSLTDAGRYAESWQNASSYFRAAITSEDWSKALTGARAPFGEMLSRDAESASYETTLPGAPDGEYVVFQFKSSFEQKSSAIETVTAMKDIDGAWRVAGYFVK